MGEWGPIFGLFGVFVSMIGGFIGTVYVTRSKRQQDEPFELLRQYKLMVDTLRDDLKSARGDLISARSELASAQKEVHDLRTEVASLRRELLAARTEADALRSATGGARA